MDITKNGLVKRGHVIDVYIHGTTGMISFEIFGLKKNWQTFSDRALKVHKPKEALMTINTHSMAIDPPAPAAKAACFGLLVFLTISGHAFQLSGYAFVS